MTPGRLGMVLDRALTPDLLDVALRVAAEAGDSPDARRLLTVALRDHVSPQEAEGKTKKCLTRVWVRPPEPAREIIRWAIDHQHLDPSHTILHLGALLATFPFFGAVAAIAGRQLHLDGVVVQRGVQDEAMKELGDRSTVDVGARKVITTLRYLGLLEGTAGGPLHPPAARPTVPAELTAWMTHALLLTRQASAIGTDEAPRAFELATIDLNGGQLNGYSLLEMHSEGSRTVAVERSSTSNGGA